MMFNGDQPYGLKIKQYSMKLTLTITKLIKINEKVRESRQID